MSNGTSRRLTFYFQREEKPNIEENEKLTSDEIKSALKELKVELQRIEQVENKVQSFANNFRLEPKKQSYKELKNTIQHKKLQVKLERLDIKDKSTANIFKFESENKNSNERKDQLTNLEAQVKLERIDKKIILRENNFRLEPKKRNYNEIKLFLENKKSQNKRQDLRQELRRSARNLPAEKKAKPVTEIKLKIEKLPAIEFKGIIKYTEDFYTCAATCDEILQNIEKSNENIIPVGFDLEWPFSFQTGSGKTALAQICMSESVCYLLHIYKLNKLPASLTFLLSHPKVKLVGVNIKNDVWKLGRDFKEFSADKVVKNNCLELGVHVNKSLNQTGRWSLERLTAFMLHKRIDKNSAVRRSKWHILPLSSEQKKYAATDAYVSWLLYGTIEEKAKEFAKEEQEKEERRKQMLESGDITEPELFEIR